MSNRPIRAGRAINIKVANIRHTKDGVYIGRAMPRQGLKASPLGNPYRLDIDQDRAVPIRMYRDWLSGELQSDTPRDARSNA
jgi:hypothetical protein